MPTTIDSWTQDPSTRCENAVVVFRILIVDDSSDLAGALSRLLQRRGHRVECAQTGAEALRLAHAFQPEFVMVDASLQDLNGYEIAAMLPGVVSSTRLRIASFSGFSGEEENRLSKAAGCVSHLQKPVGRGPSRRFG